MATLDPCVQSILCGLSAPVLAAVNTVITSAVGVLNGELALIEAQLALAEVAAAPLQILSDAAQLALSELKTLANFLPVSIVAGCADIGTGFQSFNRAIDSASANAQTALDRLQRQLAFRATLTAAKADIEAAQAFLSSIQVVIRACGGAG